MMRLFFDIGNTRLKWVVERNGDFIRSGVVAHEGLGWNELSVQLGCLEQLESVWASSVAPKEIDQQLDTWVQRNLELVVNWASVGLTQSGVHNYYSDLAKLGVDRWMAVLGAQEYRRVCGVDARPVIVVDAGTAVNIELLDVDGGYQGGVILPGLALMHDSLVGRAEGIDSTLVDVVDVIGQNTQQCVNSGVRYGLLGAVERVIDQICRSLDCPVSDVLLLLTGGDADFVGQNSRLDFVVQPQLVLSGLMSVASDGERS